MSGVTNEKGVPGSELISHASGERKSALIKHAYRQIRYPVLDRILAIS